MKFFRWYQYLAPLVLLPFSYLLWLDRFAGEHRRVWLALSIPVIFAYVVPAVGANWLRLWEFNTRFRLGRFRPHHGFVFGTATSLLAFLCLPPATQGVTAGECLRAGVVLGSVLGFWNWLYDTYAVKTGFLVIHNRLASEGQPAEVVATDYAPVVFGVFGLCYGAALRLGELLPARGAWGAYGILLLGANLIALCVPVLAYVLASYVRRGESGLKPYRRSANEPTTGGTR